MDYLKQITDVNYVKKLNNNELLKLAEDIRCFLIDKVSKTGGHLSSNLGIVELTIALLYVFDINNNDIVFDVGHQAYPFKILTGRADKFDTLRSLDGLSGFICKKESKYDIWESGHSSTSISAATGLMIGGKNRPVVVIGDCALSSGIAFESLNFLSKQDNINPIIIINDNRMGISQTVGKLSEILYDEKTARNYFTTIGYDYYGIYDGNNLPLMIDVLNNAKNNNNKLIIHINTKKGKGFTPSENDTKGTYHGVSAFNKINGEFIEKENYSYSSIVANYLIERRKNHLFKVFCPAMLCGCKLDEFGKLYPNDLYDTGISESHAAVLAAGVALAGTDSLLLLYSTFAQRAYDQLLNDISRQDLKVIIGIDRAGIVGEDGETHQGIYDIAMISTMPNIIITMPKDEKELIGLYNYAFMQNHPMVIRYPRVSDKPINFDIDYNYVADLNWDILKKGNKAIVISYGPEVNKLLDIDDITVVNAKSLKPIDKSTLKCLFNMNLPIICYEANISNGTLYHKILEYKEENDCKSKVYKVSLSQDDIVTHGKIEEVYDRYNISLKHVIDKIKEVA